MENKMENKPEVKTEEQTVKKSILKKVSDKKQKRDVKISVPVEYENVFQLLKDKGFEEQEFTKQIFELILKQNPVLKIELKNGVFELEFKDLILLTESDFQ